MLCVVAAEPDPGNMAVDCLIAEMGHISIQFPRPLGRIADPQSPGRGALGPVDHNFYSSSNSYPAAEYCNNYKPVSSGKGSSGWYLPAAGELYVMNFSYGAINLGFQKLSKTQLSSNYYWSSSELNANNVWVVRPSDGAMGHSGKANFSNRVRCVLAF